MKGSREKERGKDEKKKKKKCLLLSRPNADLENNEK